MSRCLSCRSQATKRTPIRERRCDIAWVVGYEERDLILPVVIGLIGAFPTFFPAIWISRLAGVHLGDRVSTLKAEFATTIGFMHARQEKANAQYAMEETTKATTSALLALEKSAKRERELGNVLDTFGDLLDSNYGAETHGAKSTQRELVERWASNSGWQDKGSVKIGFRRIIACAFRRYGEHERARIAHTDRRNESTL